MKFKPQEFRDNIVNFTSFKEIYIQFSFLKLAEGIFIFSVQRQVVLAITLLDKFTDTFVGITPKFYNKYKGENT